jgi:hypothetical protein
MIKIYGSFILMIILLGSASGQLIKKDQLIRIGFGISSFTDSHVNSFIDQVKEAALETGVGLNVTPLSDHFSVFGEYEKEINSEFSYCVFFQYHNEKASGLISDFEQKIEQAMSLEFTSYEAGLNLIYYFSYFQLGPIKTRLLLGAGGNLSYIELDSFYYFDQRPLYLQTLGVKRNGTVFGGKIFAGIDIPFVESFNLQIRLLYSYKPERTFSGDVTEEIFSFSGEDESVLDPSIFEDNNSFNFSQFEVMFGFAYHF